MSYRKTDYLQLIKNSEADIRAGRAHLAHHRIQQLGFRRIPREHRRPIANICRRIGAINAGLRLLAPVVRPKSRRLASDATPAEKAEYAVLLHRAGLMFEPLQLLQTIDPRAVPEALLYRAFCLFNQWEYAEAVPLLEAYVSSGISGYARLVGEVNLAAALVGAERYAEAEMRLQSSFGPLQEGGNLRLLGNALELLAQVDFFEGRLDECLAHLREAKALLSAMGTSDQFFVNKWEAIAGALKAKDVRPLEGLRLLAAERGDWESVREADRYRLRVKFDSGRFDHLVFGTPYAAYRERIYRETGHRPETQSFIYGVPGGILLDLISGEGCDRAGLAPGGKSLELVEILSRDFYRARGLGGLFAELYPEEQFDPFSSAARVHQLVFRTRQVLMESGLPLSLVESNGVYKLNFEGAVALRVPLLRRSLGGYQIEFESLAQSFGPQSRFRARQAREVLRMPRTTFQRFCHWALQSGLLETEGQGPGTVYRIVGSRAA